MSGAVSRLISSRADMAAILMRRSAEDRDADHDRMENETQREVENGPNHARDRVVAVPADRDHWRAGIASVLERDAVVTGPAEKRPEEYDRAQVAIRYEVRDCPGLHADQHGVLERAPDVAAAIGRDHENARRPHQDLGDAIGPFRRPPHDTP